MILHHLEHYTNFCDPDETYNLNQLQGAQQRSRNQSLSWRAMRTKHILQSRQAEGCKYSVGQVK